MNSIKTIFYSFQNFIYSLNTINRMPSHFKIDSIVLPFLLLIGVICSILIRTGYINLSFIDIYSIHLVFSSWLQGLLAAIVIFSLLYFMYLPLNFMFRIYFIFKATELLHRLTTEEKE